MILGGAQVMPQEGKATQHGGAYWRPCHGENRGGQSNLPTMAG